MSFLVELPLENYPSDVFDEFVADTGFCIGTARAMMWMAQLAYEVRHAHYKVKPVLARWGLEPVASIATSCRVALPLTSPRGLIAAGRGATIAAFAGTDPLVLADWLTNLNIGPRVRDIHEGFKRGIDAVWPNIEPALREAKSGERPLFVTGHSLGAALAIVAAERIRRISGIMATGVYAFGAPRVGSSAFVSAYNAIGLGERTFRLIHGHDMIPTLPPPALGFHHVGRVLSCARGGSFAAAGAPSAPGSDRPPFVATLRTGYRQRLRDLMTGRFLRSQRPGVIGWYQTFVLSPLFGDHLPERYRDALKAARAGTTSRRAVS